MIKRHTQCIFIIIILLFSCNSIPHKEIRSSFVYAIKEHGDSIYYSTNRGEVFRFHPDSPDSQTVTGVKKDHPIRTFLFSDDNRLFACSYRSGLYVIKNESLYTRSSWYHQAWSMKTDPDGNIWLAAKDGVYRQKNDTFERVTDLREAFDLDFYNKELIVAHYRGISFYDYKSGTLKRSICKDTICWMCTSIGSRLICGGVECCIIIENNIMETYKLGPEQNIPWTCTVDSAGTVILATEKGLYKIDGISGKATCIGYYQKCIKSVLFDRKGRLWVGTYF